MPRGVIVHTDRGSQYCSGDYQKMIKTHGLRCSMSGKGNCYDNACAETFFHSLKVELTHGERFATREQLRREVFEYIETDYNDASYCPSRYVLENSRLPCSAGGNAGRFAC